MFQATSLFELLDAKKINSLEIGTVAIEELTRPGILSELRTLSIDEAIKRNQDDDNDEYDDEDSWWNDYELALNCRGISPLKHLNITTYESHPCTFLPLVHWAKALSSICLNFVAHSNYFIMENFDVSQVQRILDVHSSTLSYIALTTYVGSVGASGMPNLQHFTNLREFHVSHYELFEDRYQEAASKLAAPRLWYLSVDFDREDQQHFVTEEFGDEHYYWFKGFGRKYRSLIAEGGITDIELINVNDREKEGHQLLNYARKDLEQWQISLTWPDAFEDEDDEDENDDDEQVEEDEEDEEEEDDSEDEDQEAKDEHKDGEEKEEVKGEAQGIKASHILPIRPHQA